MTSNPKFKITTERPDWVLGGLRTQRECIRTQYQSNWNVRIHNIKWTVSNLRTQHSYVIFNSAYLSLSVKLDTYTFSFESISVFLSTLICRIYKWNIRNLFGLFLLFLLSRTESLCLLIFLYILMFYKTIANIMKVTMENWKNNCFQSLREQFYILRVLCRYNSE